MTTDLVVWLLQSCAVCPFSWLSWRIFLCQIPFLYLGCIFSQLVFGFPIIFRFWQKVGCRSCTSSGWSFACDILSLYPVVHFLRMWLCGIMAITNSGGNSASPWKCIFWGLYLCSTFSSCCQFHSPGLYGLLDKLYDLIGYLIHFETV